MPTRTETSIHTEQALARFRELARPLDEDFAGYRDDIRLCYRTAVEQSEANRPVTALDWVQILGGVAVVESSDFNSSASYRCAERVFGTVMGEPWAEDGFIAATHPRFWSEPVTWLTETGYYPIENPRPGCIVAYGGILPDDPPPSSEVDYKESVWLEHFGILGYHDGRQFVVSKWGRWHTLAHPVGLVSSLWGRRVWFLGKERRTVHSALDLGGTALERTMT